LVRELRRVSFAGLALGGVEVSTDFSSIAREERERNRLCTLSRTKFRTFE
jgi:hypothetical protein